MCFSLAAAADLPILPNNGGVVNEKFSLILASSQAVDKSTRQNNNFSFEILISSNSKQNDAQNCLFNCFYIHECETQHFDKLRVVLVEGIGEKLNAFIRLKLSFCFSREKSNFMSVIRSFLD